MHSRREHARSSGSMVEKVTGFIRVRTLCLFSDRGLVLGVPIGRVRREERCYRRLTLASVAPGGP